MQLVLNNKDDERIEFSSFSRQLAIDTPDVEYQILIDFVAPCATNNVYLAQYSTITIRNIKIYNNANELVLELENLNAKILHYGEYLDDTGYSGSLNIDFYPNTGIED